MLKTLPNSLSKAAVKDGEESERSDYNQKNIIIGGIHSLVIPFLLGWLFGVNYAWAYLTSMSVLYVTVFKHKPTAGVFFTALFPFVCFVLLFLSPIVYHEHAEKLINLSHIILE